ncbi:MAG: DHH family phosphoesterase, partial [Spirochaetales bacterium]|nr:DHH family phosphoesterase [Spirochaetales bacterium]
MKNAERINNFLMSSKGEIPNNGMVAIVLGNEAADLDSMVSAILYGYLLSSGANTEVIIPVINIPRNDYKLRTEAVYLFQEAGIDTKAMTFIDEIDIDKLKEGNRLRLVLVDHNQISSRQEALNVSVTEIIDHHADEKSYSSTTHVEIEPVGSAATLVTGRFLSAKADLLEGSAGTLLLGTILLDTVNLDESAGRVTAKDLEAAKQLLELSGKDQRELFDRLQYEKFNVSALESYDLLRKDYKEWKLGDVSCGIGSVLMPAEEWLKKDAKIFSAFETYVKERKLDVLIAMNAYTDPEFSRDLGVYVPNDELRSKLISFFQASDLGLEKMDVSALDGNKEGAFFHQKNL